jgi:type II secretory pathway pseudopilin PulG
VVAVRSRVAGFTYLTILFVVAFMGISLAVAGQVWHTQAMRNREAELLYAGNQYRQAIGRYYISGPRQYPRALEDLLRDPRQPGTVRYLRKLYLDPVTGKSEWGIVKAPDGGVMGVYSTSGDKPVKTGGFTVVNAAFENAEKYSDWRFVYDALAQQAPAQSQQQPGQPQAAPSQNPLSPQQQGPLPSQQAQPQPPMFTPSSSIR